MRIVRSGSRVSCPQSARAVAVRSSGNAAGGVVGQVCRRVYHPYEVRAQFPDQWAAWCRANFRSSVDLAAAFGVCEKTARLWMEGVNAPQGWAVGAAMQGLVQGVPPFVLDAA